MTNIEEHMPSQERLHELLYGRAIVKAEIRDESPTRWGAAGPVGYLTLDDGKTLKVWGNDGGCSCSAGCYPLTVLNEWPNAIMNVVVDEAPDGEHGDGCSCAAYKSNYECEHVGHYRIFVVAEDRHLIASFDGSDGNGFYGTGWWLEVVEVAS